jgi:predicted Na+-dependent transporter
VGPTYILTVVLPAAVGVIMFGLGLNLTASDFARVVQFPRAVVAGLLVQTVVLVAVAFAITQLFDLTPMLAVGFMLLAASPGGALANIFSHLAHGDVALNITLTALNGALALVWLPLVLNWSLTHFLGAELSVPAPTQKIMEVATVIILPVLIGMLVRQIPSASLRWCCWPSSWRSRWPTPATRCFFISAPSGSPALRSTSFHWPSAMPSHASSACRYRRQRRSRSRSACTMPPSRSSSP